MMETTMTSQTVKIEVGQTVHRRIVGDTKLWTVSWVSKCGELIATEANGYHNTCDWASGYEVAK
jgi:hypothetical protein